MAFRASIDTGLPSFPPDKIAPDLHKELIKIYTAFQNLQLGIDRINRSIGIYAADITYGKIVSVYDASGTHVKLATASASGTAMALGFCPTHEGVASGKPGEVQYHGIIEAASAGLAPGSLVYLSATIPGTFTPVAPVGVGNIVQVVGFAVSATDIYFNPQLTYITL